MEPRHYYSTKYARTAVKLEEAEKTIEQLLIALDDLTQFVHSQDTAAYENAVALLKQHGKV